jgi:hypothetical protein
MKDIVETSLIRHSSFTDLLHMNLVGFHGFPKSHSQSHEHSINFSAPYLKPFPRLRQGLRTIRSISASNSFCYLSRLKVNVNAIVPLLHFGKTTWQSNVTHVFRIPVLSLMSSSSFWSNMPFAFSGLKMEADCYSGISDQHASRYDDTA